MASTIQRYPQGLVELFDLKEGGVTLPFIANTMLPTFPVESFFLSTNADITNFSEAATSQASHTRQVPQDELWWVHWISASCDVLDSDQFCVVVPCVRDVGARQMVLGLPATAAADTRTDVGYKFNALLPPGWDWGLQVTDISVGAAGNVTITSNIMRTVIPI